MKMWFCAFAFLGSSLPNGAGELPALEKKEWLGVYAGYEGRGFEFALGADGSTEFYATKSKKRVRWTKPVKIRYVLQEKVKDRWVRRKMARDGFSGHEEEAVFGESPVSFVATYTGDTKVEITHYFDKNGVQIRGKVVEQKTENPLLFGVEIVMPEVWRKKSGERKMTERDLKKLIKDAEVIAVRAEDGKRVKYEMWQNIKLTDEKELGGGAREVLLDVRSQFDNRKVSFTSGNEQQAVFQFQQSGHFYSGFRMTWQPKFEDLGKSDCFLQIKVK